MALQMGVGGTRALAHLLIYCRRLVFSSSLHHPALHRRHVALRFLLAAWHLWGLAQAEPAETRMNLIQTRFPSQNASHILTSDVTCGKPYHLSWGFLQALTDMYQSPLLNTVPLQQGLAFNTTGESTAKIFTVLPM